MSTEAVEVVERLTIQEELELIRERNNGLATPREVVDFARDPETALHGQFTWDDSAAAEKFRLWQARQVLRVFVHYEIPEPHDTQVKLNLVSNVPKKPARTTRGTVSLPSDRKNGSGYRWVEDVLQDKDRRKEMLQMAKQDLGVFRRKYKTLSELADVHAAIDKVIAE